MVIFPHQQDLTPFEIMDSLCLIVTEIYCISVPFKCLLPNAGCTYHAIVKSTKRI